MFRIHTMPVLYVQDASCCWCSSFLLQKFCLLLSTRLGYGLDDLGSKSWWQGIYLFSKMSRPALEPVQSPIHLVVGVLSMRCESSWGKKLTTYLHLMLRLRMCGAIFSLSLYAFMVYIRMTLLLCLASRNSTVWQTCVTYSQPGASLVHKIFSLL